ncbi:uncharacterized protein N7482_010314 [Penicillium canariense]|uniref:NACHT domain-containing protein n=1 Tax=Penicillium canariense TaxID=189055 RepID=A0A9W9HMQ2_9EURO|nr:uncharacterized protein N7482_010314 [Penicillium canariense]KAJ5151062.1 hypothetical protein N7482_010314 [Penicillium canariense]
MAEQLQRLLDDAAACLDTFETDADLERFSDDEFSRYDSDDFLDDASIYIDCLLDLSSALESPVAEIDSRDDLCHQIKGTTKSHWIVPVPRNPNFEGRRLIRRRIVNTITSALVVDTCQRIALVGPEDVGKSQIAIEAAYQIREQDPECSVFWVSATEPWKFTVSCMDIGLALRLKDISDNSDELDIHAKLKTALSDERAGKWVMIVDGADDMDGFFDVEETGQSGGLASMASRLPSSNLGTILLTTRDPGIASKFTKSTIEVKKRTSATAQNASEMHLATEMDQSEALKVFETCLSKDQISSKAENTALLEFLGDHPLAIKQAAEYMVRTRITVPEYLKLCVAATPTVAQFDEYLYCNGHYEVVGHPVLTTWSISFERFLRSNHPAVEFLTLLSFIAEGEIPESLLQTANVSIMMSPAETSGSIMRDSKGTPDVSGPSKRQKTEFQKSLWGVDWPLTDSPFSTEDATKVFQNLGTVGNTPSRYYFQVQEAINTLMRFAFINQRTGSFSCEIHKLVQVAMRAWLEQRGEQGDASTKAIKHTLANFPDPTIHTNRDAVISYLPHAEAALKFRASSSDRTATAGLLGFVGYSYDRLGIPRAAEELNREAYNIEIQTLGPDHPDTHRTAMCLALSLWRQKQDGEAERLIRSALAGLERLLGQDHPDTLSGTSNLVAVVHGQGRHEETWNMLQQVFYQNVVVPNTSHAQFGHGQNDRRGRLHMQPRHMETERALRTSLESHIQVLGLTDPVTLVKMDNLAHFLAMMGRVEEAESWHRQAASGLEAIFRSDHPWTQELRNGFAKVRATVGVA